MTASPVKDLEDLPPVFTVYELRDVLRISLPKAYELAHQQGFPKLYVGRSIRIPRNPFIAWLGRRGAHGSEPEQQSPEVVHVG
jgi:excisionase family DNA binding protein